MRGVFLLGLFISINVWAGGNCIAYFHGKSYSCAYGRSGISANKHEGDGATPTGTFALRQVYYRNDRIPQPTTKLPITALQPNMGWCDDIRSPFYNQLVQLPFAYSHEELWKKDNIYNIIVVVGYNDKPVIKNKGSAIFLHIARPGYKPTSGCVAFSESDLKEILSHLTSTTRVKIIPQLNSKSEFNKLIISNK